MRPQPPPPRRGDGSGRAMTRKRAEREALKRPATGEWTHSTVKLLDEARQTKQASMILRDQNAMTKKLVDREVVDTFNQVNDELRKKVNITAKLRARLEKQMQQTTAEIAALLQARGRVKHMLEERVKPLKVAQARLSQRKRRPSVEQINDHADRTLQNEAAELQQSVSSLQHLVNGAAEVLSKLEHSRSMIEQDLYDKSESLRLDRACLEVSGGKRRKADETSPAFGANPKPGNTSQTDRWQRSTNQLLTEAGELEHLSMRLRQEVAKALNSLSTSHHQALGVVNDALRSKVKQTKALHTQLENNLRAVCAEIDDLYQNKELIERTLAAKQAPLDVVKKRLELRRQRPDREAIRDGVEDALQQELTTLKTSMDSLRSKLVRIDKEAHQLEKLRRALEKDLVNKGSALQHDKRALAIDLNAINDTGSIRGSERSAMSMSARSGQVSLPSIRSVGLSGGSSAYMSGSRTHR